MPHFNGSPNPLLPSGAATYLEAVCCSPVLKTHREPHMPPPLAPVGVFSFRPCLNCLALPCRQLLSCAQHTDTPESLAFPPEVSCGVSSSTCPTCPCSGQYFEKLGIYFRYRELFVYRADEACTAFDAAHQPSTCLLQPPAAVNVQFVPAAPVQARKLSLHAHQMRFLYDTADIPCISHIGTWVALGSARAPHIVLLRRISHAAPGVMINLRSTPYFF